MIFQHVEPCKAGWSPVEIITATAAGLNLLLLTFLAKRRVKKDRVDEHRWSTCPLLAGRPSSLRHRHSGDGDARYDGL